MAWLSDPNWLTRAAQGGLQAYGEARQRGMSEQEMLAAQDYRQQQLNLSGQAQELARNRFLWEKDAETEARRRQAALDISAERQRAFERGGALAGIGAFGAARAEMAPYGGYNLQDAADVYAQKQRRETAEAEATLRYYAAQTSKAQRPEEHTLPAGSTLVRGGQVVLRTPAAQAKPDMTPYAVAPYGVVNTQTGGVQFIPQPVFYQDAQGNPQMFYPSRPGAKPGIGKTQPAEKPDTFDVTVAKNLAQYLAGLAKQGITEPAEVAKYERNFVRQQYQAANRIVPAAYESRLEQILRQSGGGTGVAADKAPTPPAEKQGKAGVARPAPTRAARRASPGTARATSRQPAGAADAIEAQARYLKRINYTPAEIAASLARQYPLDRARQYLARAGYSPAQIWDAVIAAHPQLGAH